MPPYLLASDEKFMRIAIREALKARGMTAPNPIVGAVIVKNRLLSKLASIDEVQGAYGEQYQWPGGCGIDYPKDNPARASSWAAASQKSEHIDVCDASSAGATQQFASEVEFRKKSDGRILVRGHHACAGEAHAEIAAIKNLPSLAHARGATLYVTLEPCSTFGKTPPCTTAIIEAGFARVVYGATDPNPEHQGKADALLKKAGIEVTTGILKKECAALNASWNHRMLTGMPWVIAKCGMSLDGCLVPPADKRWITSPASRRDAMKLRAEVDAILIGGATVRADDPALTLRGIGKKGDRIQPWRIIWTRDKKNIPKKSQLLCDEYSERTMIMENMPLRDALQNLALRGISSVMIEGGGETLRAAFENNLVDEVRFYVAPKFLGGPSWISNSKTRKEVTARKASYNQDEMITHISQLIAPLKLVDVSFRSIEKDVVLSGFVRK